MSRVRRGAALSLVLLSLLALPACRTADADVVTGSDVLDIVEASNGAPRQFTVERITDGGPRAEARGRVEDDYRYEVTFTVDGAEAFTEVVYDDSRFVRPALRPETPEWMAAAAGQWLRDPAGSPSEFSRPGAPAAAVPAQLALTQVRFLEDLPEVLRGMRKWDPDSSSYLEAHDKFPPHEEEGTRFDVVPSAYDGDVVFRDGVRDDLVEQLRPFFLYLSVWVKDGRVRRVESLFDIDVERVRADVARVRRAADEQTGRLSSLPLPEPPPRYRERYLLEYPDEPVRVVKPEAVALLPAPQNPTEATP